MKLVSEVPIQAAKVEAFNNVLGPGSIEETRAIAERLRRTLDDRVIWNVNSTAAGGGVAEMLHTLLPYARGLGVDTRWLVVSGNPDFFRVTKRLHNALHGERGDGSPLDAEASRLYEDMVGRNAVEMVEMVRPGDVVILHDPQTAGLIPHLAGRDVGLIWRCHVGMDGRSEEGDHAWAFLEPYLTQAHAFIFSRFTYLPDNLYHGRCLISPPSIDPFSPKNQEMDAATVRAILAHTGIVGGDGGPGGRTFLRNDGSPDTVERRADILRDGAPPAFDTPLVTQVSRWDRLKDPVGVLQGFVRAAESDAGAKAHLVLAGPSVAAVADDPEGAEVFNEVAVAWRALPEGQRRRVHLVNLPMDDLQENAAMVNALQRHSAVVVQKSLREGFGLTVTEAMWKSRPVIASAVGGIQDQIVHGVSGLLLKYPDRLDTFAGALTQVLGNPGFARSLGENARLRVCQNYLGLSSLARFADLIERLKHDPQAFEGP
jgi:trehalose synthase